jgi:spermidine synthase
VGNDSLARDAELAGFVPLLALGMLAAAHEGIRQTDAYLGPGLSAPRGLAVGLLLVGFALGAWWGRGTLLRARQRTSLLMRLSAALAGSCAAAGPLWFCAFQSSSALWLVGCGLPAALGLLAGAALGALLQAAGLAYRELGALGRMLGPLPLLAALALALAGAVGLSYAGLWRAGAVLGLVTAALSLLLRRYGAYFSDRDASASFSATLALAASALSLALAQAFVPASVVARYPAEVVWVQGDDSGLVVTSAQNTLQLFEAGQLRLSSVDAYRLAESAVHPALSALKRRRRVLLFGPAGGFLEREVLRYPDVAELLSVAELDAAAFRRSSWPQKSLGQLADRRLRFEVAEPLDWLARCAVRFDAILVSLPLPVSYVEGKHYTRYFYQQLADRLAPEGVLVIQATSRASLPITFATIRETLHSAGFISTVYEAPVPLQGALSFVIASRSDGFRFDARGLPAGLRFLDAAALERAAALGGPSTALKAPISTLDRQHAVESWQREASALGE